MLKANFSAEIIILPISHAGLSSGLRLESKKPHAWEGYLGAVVLIVFDQVP